jgi:DNA-binding beta-propeller fold protein YncE
MIDEANARVVVLDRKLSLLRAFGGSASGTIPRGSGGGGSGGSGSGGGGSGASGSGEGSADGRLFRPTDLALSPSGEIVYVVDAADCRVKAFDSQGKPLFAFGRRGDGATDFACPFGVAAGPDASVYVTDEYGHKVVRFEAAGRPSKSFGKEGLGRVEFFKPRGVAFDARGRLVVVDWGNHRGQVLTSDGEFVQAFGSRIFIQPTLKRP